MKLSIRVATAALALSGLMGLAPAAMAHHGWSWAESEQMTLQGTVQQVQIAPPHPWLDVRADDGVWRVELGNPTQTKDAGFVEAPPSRATPSPPSATATASRTPSA